MAKRIVSPSLISDAIRSIPDKIKTENNIVKQKGLVIHPQTSGTPEIVLQRELSPLHNTMPNNLFRCPGFYREQAVLHSTIKYYTLPTELFRFPVMVSPSPDKAKKEI